MRMQEDLREFVALLNSHHVEYLVVGAYAMGCHGVSRYNGVADFFLARTPVNAARVMEVLAAFGFGQLSIGLSDLQTPDTVIQLGYAPNRIDLLTSLTGSEFTEAWPERVTMQTDGVTIEVIGRKHLIQNKAALARPRDLADIEMLRAL